MKNTISLACLLLVALALPARAELPKSFDWSDANVRNLVKESTDLHELASGTDGKGDTKANLLYVSARNPIMFPNSHLRIAASGLPWSAIDGDTDPLALFKGLDGIESSKVQNIDIEMKLHPGKRYVLMGDTLQRDPEVYEWVLENHKDQVEAVLIHKAGDHGQDRKPEDYKGEIFFDHYDDAIKAVTD